MLSDKEIADNVKIALSTKKDEYNEIVELMIDPKNHSILYESRQRVMNEIILLETILRINQ